MGVEKVLDEDFGLGFNCERPREMFDMGRKSKAPTPMYYRVRDRLESIYQVLDHEKITHWLMNFSRGVNIDDCRGGRITTGGALKFEGSPREVFWSFMAPCLLDIVNETLVFADDLARKYLPAVADQGLQETEGLLKSFVSQVYRRMAEIDRRLRGEGFPANVSPRDVSDLVENMHKKISERAAAFRTHYPHGISRLIAYVEKHPAIVGGVFTLVAALIGLAVL